MDLLPPKHSKGLMGWRDEVKEGTQLGDKSVNPIPCETRDHMGSKHGTIMEANH